jgi:hypothetical protein
MNVHQRSLATATADTRARASNFCVETTPQCPSGIPFAMPPLVVFVQPPKPGAKS